MKGLKLCQGRNGACRSGVTAGAALILTLAVIVILTALVLLFITHSLLETQVSVASADQTAAALFARGAVDSVIGNLKQEINAGSATLNGATFPPSGSDLRNPDTVFLPATNQSMVPYRMDPGAPPNVLKRSERSVAPYPISAYYSTSWQGPKWAAPYSTTNVDTSGRSISLARWNAPLLMPTTNTPGSGETNLTPVSSFIPPDWVYFRRMATTPAISWNANLIPNMATGTLNPNYVVGRYAYVVYDEGGLLDANAAGYPSTALDGSSITPVMMRHKISEACADLTQIGLNSSDITNLVAWRNPINDATATTYTNYVYSATTNAFLTPAPGERMFTSRQQLIDFLTQNVAGNNPAAVERMQGALPYLTTFSRELNEPCWYPQTNMAAGGYSYTTTATSTPASATNAFAPLERAGSMYTNLSGLVCNANQPLAFSRFPLSRLSWLGTNGPANNATAAQIQQSFGLVWDSVNNAWIYAGPTGSTVQTSVATLSTINGREPNFFEMLKAGILSGSVNIVPQPVFTTFPNPGDLDSRYGTNNSAGVEIPVPDQQTMQIGLAAIDQASTNALPTRVEFGSNAGTNPQNGEDQALYGSKNLPYIDKIVTAFYHPTTTPADTPDGNTNAYFSAWAQPVFWSPYLSAVTNTAPLQIRIRADSTNAGSGFNQFFADTYNTTVDDRIGSPSLPCGGPGNSTGAGGTNGATIELDAANAATLQNATINPVLLASLLTSGAVANPPTINDLRAQNPVGWTGPGAPTDADLYTEPGGPTYDGFWMGLAVAPLQLTDSHHSTATPLGPFNAARLDHDSFSAAGRVDHQFVLEANYGTSTSPRFLEVQRMNFKYFAQSPEQVQEADLFTVPNRQLDWYAYDDPRTGRFPFIFMNPTSYGVNNPVNPVTAADTSQLTYTLFPNSTDPFTGKIANTPAADSSSINILPSSSAGGVSTSPTSANPGQDIFRFADNSASSYSSQNPAYQDGDGAQRPGDAWWSSTSANTMPMRIDAGTTQYRPVILNRPFYSVGELGYVYRDMPWRSLSFNGASSADAGLLDFFCVNDGYAGSTNAPVIAGVLDLNTQNPQVLQAMLNGAARAELYPGTSSSSPVGYDVTATDATNMAYAITNYTSTTGTISSGPLLNKSEIATRLTAANVDTASPSTDSNIKERQETIVRALASAGQVRTWNLMIDVIAQTGHFPPNATGFNNFIVTAEQRYWAHVAIDRYTGQVVSMQLEPVSQ